MIVHWSDDASPSDDFSETSGNVWETSGSLSEASRIPPDTNFRSGQLHIRGLQPSVALSISAPPVSRRPQQPRSRARGLGGGGGVPLLLRSPPHSSSTSAHRPEYTMGRGGGQGGGGRSVRSRSRCMFATCVLTLRSVSLWWRRARPCTSESQVTPRPNLSPTPQAHPTPYTSPPATPRSPTFTHLTAPHPYPSPTPLPCPFPAPSFPALLPPS